jgi:hypothetical protein
MAQPGAMMLVVDNHLQDDDNGMPPENLERLGIRFYFDTNFVTDTSDAATRLRQLHEEGWINLWRTDTVDTELQNANDEKRRGLLDRSAPYVESMGVLVWDHSRWGHAIWGNDDDAERLDRVFRVLFPGSKRTDQSTGRSRRKLRDAMHVATAIRYGANGFITRDEADLLARKLAIADDFDGFQIMTPEEAFAFVERARARNEAQQDD